EELGDVRARLPVAAADDPRRAHDLWRRDAAVRAADRLRELAQRRVRSPAAGVLQPVPEVVPPRRDGRPLAARRLAARPRAPRDRRLSALRRRELRAAPRGPADARLLRVPRR